ncbi:MAG: hypothetical protein GY906_01365 [bacterium]|nr:hypothetical protein [bacterium]
MSERYTGLSDRFRSLWTFYQFLGGVFKHQERGELPYSYDFQALYREVQELMPRLGRDNDASAEMDLDRLSRELSTIHSRLARIEREFTPSLLRRFFDHLKRQDQKILIALVKFYLQLSPLEEDGLDKLDMLLTRLAEEPLENGRVSQRDPSELRESFERLASFAGLPRIPAEEERPLLDAVVEIRTEFRSISTFDALLTSGIYDRFRELKHRLGMSFLHPPLLAEIISTNIDAKNRFRELYQEEEVRILEDTNRIFEIERYLERNPELAHSELRRQIETFRRFRIRFDSGRRDDNVKREDIHELRRSMGQVLEQFEPIREAIQGDDESISDLFEVSDDYEPVEQLLPADELDDDYPDDEPTDGALLEIGEEEADSGGIEDSSPEILQHPPAFLPKQDPPEDEEVHDVSADTASLSDLLPPDPMLNEYLHKIMFALELVVWDHQPEQAANAKELHYLRLEPWEVDTYRRLVKREVFEGTFDWELEAFFLTSAALRAKMEEEDEEISRLYKKGTSERLFELLEKSAQSLERAREVDRRFRWFIEDMLYRGDTERLEQIYRSHFRLLNAFSQLWLDHQASGGITPL